MTDDGTQTVAERIENALERLILDGELAPGAHINENAMAERFGVSRAPVREACRLLQRAGLVDIVPNKGSFVRAPSLAEIVNLFDVRASLGRLAGRLAAAAVQREQIQEMRHLITEMDACSRDGDAERYIALNIAFHGVLYGATDNPRLASLDMRMGKELRVYRRHGLAFGGGLAVSNAEHRAILAAIENGDCDTAGTELERHILNGRDRFIRAMTATGKLILVDGPQVRTART